MIKNRNIALLISLIVLSTITVFVALYEPSAVVQNSEQRRFALADTASIDRVVIQGKGFSNELSRSGKGWMLNGKYTADPNLAKVLLAVFNRVRVSRPVAKKRQQAVKSQMVKDGVKVEVYGKGEKLRSFLSSGNQNQTESYFMESGGGQAYVVNLPGYNSFVAGLFTMPGTDWRDRTIFATNWQEIQRLEMQYTINPEQSFEIAFAEQFYAVSGIQQLDTAAMVSYMQLFAYVPADRLIETGTNPVLDSLKNTKPWFTLKLEALQPSKNNTLTVFRQPEGTNSYLGIDREGQMMLLNRQKILTLAKKRKDFRQK